MSLPLTHPYRFAPPVASGNTVHQWDISTGATFQSVAPYFGDDAVDAEEYFKAIKQDTDNVVRWVDPVTKAIKEIYYSAFPSPGWVNEIGNIQNGQGYIVKCPTNPLSIIKAGVPTDPVTHNLTTGQHTLARISGAVETATEAFAGIVGAGKLIDVQWVNPDDLVTYTYDGVTDNIGQLIQGQTYIVNVNADYSGFTF